MVVALLKVKMKPPNILYEPALPLLELLPARASTPYTFPKNGI
jgi:hypothetical protein